jgi:hypothetical protein
MLDYEAKRRPTLAALLAGIDHLSEEAIQASPLPLPWMRQALLQYKREHTVPVVEAHQSYVPDPDGEMRQWFGDSAFIRVGQSSLQICDGQLVWFGPDGVWIDTIRTTLIDPLLRTRTASRGRMSKSAYHHAVRSRMQRLLEVELVSDQTVLGHGTMYRIYRPAG